MRKFALGSLLLVSLIVVAALVFFVFRHEYGRALEAPHGASHAVAISKALAIPPASSAPGGTPRLEVDDEPPLANPAAICSLHGFVFPAAGSREMPLDKLVELEDERSTLKWTRIDEAGAYSLEHLAPGHYWLTSGSSPEDRAWAEVVLDPITPSQRVDLRLVSPPRLRIRVVDNDGLPLENRELMPIATSEPPGDWFDELASNHGTHFGVGQYSRAYRDDSPFDASSIGCLLLDAPPPLYVSLLRGMRVIETRRVDALDDDVVFTIDRDLPLFRNASLRLRVVDPITHDVFIDGSSSSLERFNGEWKRSGLSSNFGERVFNDLEPGPYELTLSLVRDEEHNCVRPFDTRKYSEHCVQNESGILTTFIDGPDEDRFERTSVLRLDGGEHRDLGEITLTAGGMIAGHTRGSQGEPTFVWVDCEPFDLRTHSPTPLGRQGAWTDDEGVFRFRGLEPGQYLLRAGNDQSVSWVARSVLVEVRDNSVCDVELRVMQTTKCMLFPTLANWRAQRFEMRDGLGLPVLGVERFQSPRPRELLLAPGRYELRSWTLPQNTPSLRAIEVADEPLSIELR